MTEKHARETEQPTAADVPETTASTNENGQGLEPSSPASNTGKPTGLSRDVEVPTYPLQPHREERQVFGGLGCYCLSLALAPREQTVFGQSHSRDWVWWEPTPEGMNWFRGAVHEWLIRKRGFRREDLKTWTFSDLAWKIEEVVREEDQAATASWKRELQEVLETGRENRAYWHQRVTEAVAQLQAYHDSLQSGKPVLRAPMPFMTAAFTSQVGTESGGPAVKIPQGHWRIPEPDDVPWACLVLGIKIEALFRVSRLLIPEEVWQGIRKLEHLIENAIWIPIGFPEAPVGATASVDDLKAWWWFIKQDLCHRRLPAHGDAPPPERNGAEGSKQRMGNPQSADTHGKPESPNRVTLAEFIQTYCEGGLTDRRIESLKNSLQAAARNGKLVLPRYTCSGGGEWTKGKRKYYTATSLIQRWADYQRELPSLPPLRPPSTD